MRVIFLCVYEVLLILFDSKSSDIWNFAHDLVPIKMSEKKDRKKEEEEDVDLAGELL